VDAEIFAYLVAWPLEWGGIPESYWNNQVLHSAFDAEDRGRRRVYEFSFVVTTRHLSEGLFQRTLALIVPDIKT
jgi:hypothetical protein